MRNNSTSSSISLEQSTHLSDAQWANFWASLLLRYQQSQLKLQLPAMASSSTEMPTAIASASLAPAPLNLAIAVAELLLDLVAVLPNAYFLFLLCARHDLHNNLRVLLGSFSACLVLIAVTRIPTQISYISTGVLYVDAFRWLVFGHEIAVMFFRSVIVPLTMERVLATVRSKSYEQQQSPAIGICAVLLTLVVSTAIGLYIGSELNSSLIRDGVISFRGDFYGLYHVIDVSARLLVWVLCFCVFVALLQYNQRCYAFSRLPNKHTLVQRYQFAENVRSSRLLLVIGTIVFVCNLHFDFVMLRIAYNKDYFEVEYSQSFDFVLALALNAIPLAAIWFHPSMLSASKSHGRRLCRIFLHRCCCIRQPIGRSPSEPESPSFLVASASADGGTHCRQIQKSPRALITGQKLIVRRAEEQRVYFEELSKSWNVKDGKRRGRRNTGG